MSLVSGRALAAVSLTGLLTLTVGASAGAVIPHPHLQINTDHPYSVRFSCRPGAPVTTYREVRAWNTPNGALQAFLRSSPAKTWRLPGVRWVEVTTSFPLITFQHVSASSPQLEIGLLSFEGTGGFKYVVSRVDCG